MNWNTCGRKQLWSHLRYYPAVYLEVMKTITNLSQDSQSRGQDLNQGLLNMKQECQPLNYDIQYLTMYMKAVSILSDFSKAAHHKKYWCMTYKDISL
jgi:hypothetical protein